MPGKVPAVIEARLKQDLQQWQTEGLYRQCVEVTPGSGASALYDGQPVLHFAGNDYLGLTQHPDVVHAFKQGVDRYGVGSGASQVVSGYTGAHRALEEALVEFTGYEAALLFSSGYLCNIATINGLVKASSHLWQDRLNHASLLDGGRLCGASMWRYRHGDVSSLKSRLETALNVESHWIITEGVFSMEGDLAPLPELVTLAREHHGAIILDDAHGLGVLGEKGHGTLAHYGLQPQAISVLTATFGKALGSSGAFVAGSSTLIESIRQFARPYICTTAIPAAVAEANRAALKVMQAGEERGCLHALIARFCQGVAQLALPVSPSITPIQSLQIGCPKQAMLIQQALLKKGFFTGLMRPPTVPPNTARLRITLSAKQLPEHIDGFLDALDQVLKEYRNA